MKSEQVRTAKTDCISAENQYHPIDINNWNRRDLYDHFSRLKLPHFAVAAYIDVTRLLEYKRREGLSFYLSLIYLTTEVLNGIDNFRLRIIDGQVVSFDTIHTNFTHKRPEEEVFRFYTAPFEGTLRQYVETTSKAIASQTTLFGGMGDIPNVVYCSCTPNLDATALINPGMENPDDAIPRVNWGKYVERDGRWMINVTFTANHRFIDGYHIGLFFERLQSAINDL
jgi:chloramphenicol O-acetyltransferase